jgi:hypothetical protein
MYGAGGLADLKLGHHDKDGIEVLDVAFSDGAVHVPGVPRFSPTLPRPEPVAAAVTSWAGDPWTGGAYTHIPPGASVSEDDPDSDLYAESGDVDQMISYVLAQS